MICLIILTTQETDIIISSIYIWENLSMENLGKVLTVTQLISEAKAWVKKSVHCRGVVFFLSFLTFKICFEIISLLKKHQKSSTKNAHIYLSRFPIW